MPPVGEDDFQNVADHFEQELDREQAPPKERTSRATREARPLFEQEVDRREAAGGDEEPLEDEDPRHQQQEEVDDEAEEDDDPKRREPDEEEEDEEQEASVDLNQVVRVNVDGQPQEVSLQEALNGYVRTQTFHQRLAQLSEVAQNVDKERAQLSQHRDYYARLIPALQQQLASLQPQEPDWDKLYAEDATEAARLERQWRTYREKLEAINNEHKRVTEEQQQEAARRTKVYEDTQRQLLARAMPQWTDGKHWERDRKSMVRSALAVGYSEQEIGQLVDARATVVLWKAAQWDRMMAAKPKPVRQQGAMRPGAIPSRGAASNGQLRADRRLQRSGSVRDAAKAFEVDLDRER